MKGTPLMTKNINKDVHNTGLSGIRLVSNFIKKTVNEVIQLTVGASEGIDLAIRALVNPGDEVIFVSPGYTAYKQAVTLAGGVPVVVDTRSSNFRLLPNQLEEVISEKSKLVILNYPNNPSGVVLSSQELVELANVIKRHDLYVLTDDVYNRLVYDQDFAPSIASVPDMKERTLVLHGLSKSHSMTGWRIGYLLGPECLIHELYKIHQTDVGCASSISQEAAMTALTVDRDNPSEIVPIFRERRDYVLKRLDEIGISYIKPEGTFYVFANIEKFGMTSLDFVKFLIETVDLAVVHGSAFTEFGEGFIRISYAMDLSILKEALDRFQAAVAKLNNQKSLS